MSRPAVAFVVQRYGADVTGGSEALARALAERLVPSHDVTVFTTCARDYVTWRNELPAGEEGLGRRARAALPGRARARPRRLQRVRRAPLRPADDARGGARVPGAPGAGGARARRGAARRARPLRGRRLLHLPLLPDLLGAQSGAGALDPGADDARRAAAALLDLPGGLRAPARVRVPHAGRAGARARAVRHRGPSGRRRRHGRRPCGPGRRRRLPRAPRPRAAVRPLRRPHRRREGLRGHAGAPRALPPREGGAARPRADRAPRDGGAAARTVSAASGSSPRRTRQRRWPAPPRSCARARSRACRSCSSRASPSARRGS